MLIIRRLIPSDALAFQTLRLAGLRESPSAFGSSYEEEHNLPLSIVEDRLAAWPDRGVFGAFLDDELCGIVALGRETKHKLAHKALIWGLYVLRQARGKGLGRALLLQAISLAQSTSEIQQINLSVNAHNGAAISLYKSLNFKVFGHEPKALQIDGEFYDEVHMYLPLREA